MKFYELIFISLKLHTHAHACMQCVWILFIDSVLIIILKYRACQKKKFFFKCTHTSTVPIHLTPNEGIVKHKVIFLCGENPAAQKGALWIRTKIKMVSVMKDFSSTNQGQKRWSAALKQIRSHWSCPEGQFKHLRTGIISYICLLYLKLLRFTMFVNESLIIIWSTSMFTFF